MKQTTRELLVTTKVVESWEHNFDSNVDGLMTLVSKVDTKQHVDRATELLDVYRNKAERQPEEAERQRDNNRPFEFTVFRN